MITVREWRAKMTQVLDQLEQVDPDVKIERETLGNLILRSRPLMGKRLGYINALNPKLEIYDDTEIS